MGNSAGKNGASIDDLTGHVMDLTKREAASAWYRYGVAVTDVYDVVDVLGRGHMGVTHGAVVKRCSHEGCAKKAVQGGVCITHGALVKRCSHEGCTKQSKKGGVCVRHGALVKRCSHEGCTKQSQNGGVCIRHGAVVKRCSHPGCTNHVQIRGVCIRHGAVPKRCSHEGCTSSARKGGLCRRHRKESLVNASGEVGLLHQPADGYEATTVGAVAGRGGGIEVRYPSDDEEKIGAWIWKSSRMARLGN
jgi:hypothetical protein